jgi:hypothetical protein
MKDTIGFWDVRRKGSEGSILRFEAPEWDEEAEQYLGQVTMNNRSASYYGKTPDEATCRSLFVVWMSLANRNS